MHAGNLHEQIRRRAHELWEQEGRPEGRAEEFWFRAETEVRAALLCMLRARSEGKSLAAIAAAVRDETGLALSEEEVDRLLREAAGPVPRQEGGDPEYFTGHLGGG